MVISLVAMVVDAVVDGIVVWADVDSGVEINALIVVEDEVVTGVVGVFVVIAVITRKNYVRISCWIYPNFYYYNLCVDIVPK